MAAILPKQKMTVEEYLAREESSEIKHEFYDGEVFAMAGASRRHNQICFNLAGALHPQLSERECSAYPSEMMIKIPRKNPIYTYPDMTVVCGREEFENDKEFTLLNPNIIIEVLSPSTEGYDRGKKFESYRAISSFQEYILIAQDRIYLEHHIRQPDESWLMTEYNQLSDTIQLPSIDCTLTLKDIYAKVNLSVSE